MFHITRYIFIQQRCDTDEKSILRTLPLRAVTETSIYDSRKEYVPDHCFLNLKHKLFPLQCFKSQLLSFQLICQQEKENFFLMPLICINLALTWCRHLGHKKPGKDSLSGSLKWHRDSSPGCATPILINALVIFTSLRLHLKYKKLCMHIT